MSSIVVVARVPLRDRAVFDRLLAGFPTATVEQVSAAGVGDVDTLHVTTPAWPFLLLALREAAVPASLLNPQPATIASGIVGGALDTDALNEVRPPATADDRADAGWPEGIRVAVVAPMFQALLAAWLGKARAAQLVAVRLCHLAADGGSTRMALLSVALTGAEFDRARAMAAGTIGFPAAPEVTQLMIRAPPQAPVFAEDLAPFVAPHLSFTAAPKGVPAAPLRPQGTAMAHSQPLAGREEIAFAACRHRFVLFELAVLAHRRFGDRSTVMPRDVADALQPCLAQMEPKAAQALCRVVLGGQPVKVPANVWLLRESLAIVVANLHLDIGVVPLGAGVNACLARINGELDLALLVSAARGFFEHTPHRTRRAIVADVMEDRFVPRPHPAHAALCDRPVLCVTPVHHRIKSQAFQCYVDPATGHPTLRILWQTPTVAADDEAAMAGPTVQAALQQLQEYRRQRTQRETFNFGDLLALPPAEARRCLCLELRFDPVTLRVLDDDAHGPTFSREEGITVDRELLEFHADEVVYGALMLPAPERRSLLLAAMIAAANTAPLAPTHPGAGSGLCPATTLNGRYRRDGREGKQVYRSSVVAPRHPERARADINRFLARCGARAAARDVARRHGVSVRETHDPQPMTAAAAARLDAALATMELPAPLRAAVAAKARAWTRAEYRAVLQHVPRAGALSIGDALAAVGFEDYLAAEAAPAPLEANRYFTACEAEPWELAEELLPITAPSALAPQDLAAALGAAAPAVPERAASALRPDWPLRVWVCMLTHHLCLAAPAPRAAVLEALSTAATGVRQLLVPPPPAEEQDQTHTLFTMADATLPQQCKRLVLRAIVAPPNVDPVEGAPLGVTREATERRFFVPALGTTLACRVAGPEVAPFGEACVVLRGVEEPKACGQRSAKGNKPKVSGRPTGAAGPETSVGFCDVVRVHGSSEAAPLYRVSARPEAAAAAREYIKVREADPEDEDPKGHGAPSYVEAIAVTDLAAHREVWGEALEEWMRPNMERCLARAAVLPPMAQ